MTTLAQAKQSSQPVTLIWWNSYLVGWQHKVKHTHTPEGIYNNIDPENIDINGTWVRYAVVYSPRCLCQRRYS